MQSTYRTIGNFGSAAGNTSSTNPLSYCAVTGLDAMFNHTMGSYLAGPNSSQCQLFMSQYCANNWDGVCEFLSADLQRGGYPNTVAQCNGPSGSCFSSGLGNALTKGQVLLRNTAQEKYLVAMSDNCRRDYAPFDPTVADSPLISRWVPGGNGCNNPANCYGDNVCVPMYGVDPRTIDSDIVMNKLLDQPWIALDIFVNMYQNMSRNGSLKELKGTRLGRYFESPQFLSVVKSGLFRV